MSTIRISMLVLSLALSLPVSAECRRLVDRPEVVECQVVDLEVLRDQVLDAERGRAAAEKAAAFAKAGATKAEAERLAVQARLDAELARTPAAVTTRWEHVALAGAAGVVVGVVVGVALGGAVTGFR